MRTAIRFFGVDHTLFASDTPFDPEKGPGYIRDTIANLNDMDILTDADRARIYHGNVTDLLGLDSAAALNTLAESEVSS
jgi:aminocarboxymuconate-semialdehyde decarboxylase